MLRCVDTEARSGSRIHHVSAKQAHGSIYVANHAAAKCFCVIQLCTPLLAIHVLGVMGILSNHLHDAGRSRVAYVVAKSLSKYAFPTLFGKGWVCHLSLHCIASDL